MFCSDENIERWSGENIERRSGENIERTRYNYGVVLYSLLLLSEIVKLNATMSSSKSFSAGIGLF